MFKEYKKTGKNGIFQVFYLKRENDAVKILETEEIDFQQVKRHLEVGECVFITPKQNPKVKPTVAWVAEESLPFS